MLEGLQENGAGYREASTTIRPVEIILDNDYALKARQFVKGARSEVRVCAYAWRWYDSEPELSIQKLSSELWMSQHRGIQVRVLVDTEAMARRLKELGFNARAVQPTRMLHTKAICVDRSTLIVGSHNLTKRANSDNYELSVAIQEFEAVEQFITYFDRIWSSRG